VLTAAASLSLQGLWRGTVPGQLLTVPYTAVQFVALQQCRHLAQQYGVQDKPRLRTAMPFLSGAVAGAAATIASYPFDLLRTTLAAQGEPAVYRSMTEAGVWAIGPSRAG
jgi:solute carrier family 25 thiamine pyrophosphate transporter 19